MNPRQSRERAGDGTPSHPPPPSGGGDQSPPPSGRGSGGGPSLSANGGGACSPAVPLYPYQRRWLQDPARFKIGMFARQTGKTFTTTLELVDSCFAAEAQGKRDRWVILSRGERQAKEAIDGVA